MTFEWKVGDQALLLRGPETNNVIIGRRYKVCGINSGRQAVIQVTDQHSFISNWIDASQFERVATRDGFGMQEIPEKKVSLPRDPFWIVKGSGPAIFEHLCQSDAESEAVRLAEMNPGETFFVLGPQKSYCKTDVQVTDLSSVLEAGYHPHFRK